MPLPLIITEAGLAKIVNNAGQALGPVEIVSLGLTDTPFTLAPTLTALPGEFKRLNTVSGLVTGPSTLHIVAADSSADVYSYCGLALYLSDGTLFAVYGQPTDIAGKSAVSETWIALDIALSAGQAASITFGNTNFVDPPASETVLGLVQLATLAEAQAGTDAQDVITPATARGAVVAWLQGQGGQGSGINADLLDGQQGAWYADIVSRLGFLPLAASAYSAADVLAKLLTVDGPASGVDADLLDGKQGAWYAPIDSAALTGTPTAPTPAAGDSSGKLANTAFVAAAMTAFAGLFTASLGTNGFLKIPVSATEVFMIQWGQVAFTDVPAGTPGFQGTASFDEAFPTACLLPPWLGTQTLAGNTNNWNASVTGFSASGFEFQVQEWASATNPGTLTYFAIGH